MPTSFQMDCPHCRSQRASFTAKHQHRFRDNRAEYVLTAVCGVCDFPTLVRYIDTELNVRTSSAIDLVGANVDFPSERLRIIEIWPESTQGAPENLPSNVENFFSQGLQNERSGNWDAAGAMFRKSLDIATKILDPTSANKNLFQRITALEKAGRLTADLAAWAHEVRIDGNASVHDDEPETREDVAAIHEFARAVLLYTFTLPALVAARSSNIETTEAADE